MYKTHKASVLSYSQTITAPWLYFAHDFLSNQRSNVRSRTNRIFSRVVFLERKLGVSVFSSLFKWDGISPVENDFEWQSQRKNHQKMGFPLPTVVYLAENLSGLKIFCSLSFIDRELLYFPPIFSFFLFLSIFYWEFGFLHSLFALPWGDSAVLCFGGKDEDSFYRPRFKIV